MARCSIALAAVDRDVYPAKALEPLPPILPLVYPVVYVCRC